MTTKNVPATTGATPLPVALQEAFMADAGQGLEEASREDFAIPFLNVLQSLSPQADADGDAYVDGAKPGMIFNNVTQEIYDGAEGIVVVPCHFEKTYNEFVPRDAGGGWRGSYDSKEAADEACAPGNEIVDTANHYLLYQSADGTWQPALLSCTSTKLKASRQWNAKMRLIQHPKAEGGSFIPATFAQTWIVKTIRTENQHGKFYIIGTEYVGLVASSDLYAAAKAFRESVQSGVSKADFNATEGDDTPTGSSGSTEGGGEY